MEKTYDIIRFKFTSPLHISNIRPDDYAESERIFHSDALYSAIYQCMALLGLQDKITENPAWTFSSLYPFYKDTSGIYHYFFKRPIYLNNKEQGFINQSSNYTKAKDYKITEYFEKQEFEELLSGNFQVDPKKIKKPLYNSAQSDISDIYEANINPRIRKPRTFQQSDPDIFYMERLYFKENAGLFCLVETKNEESNKLLDAFLKELGEQGIGTDRNIGNGKFNVEWDQIKLNLPEKANYRINTGLFLPESKESLEQMTTGKACWKLLKRGGWISEPYNTYRKRSVFMFTEGSVFKISDDKKYILGKTVDLKPENTPFKVEHPVFRVGKTFFLPLLINK